MQPSVGPESSLDEAASELGNLTAGRAGFSQIEIDRKSDRLILRWNGEMDRDVSNYLAQLEDSGVDVQVDHVAYSHTAMLMLMQRAMNVRPSVGRPVMAVPIPDYSGVQLTLQAPSSTTVTDSITETVRNEFEAVLGAQPSSTGATHHGRLPIDAERRLGPDNALAMLYPFEPLRSLRPLADWRPRGQLRSWRAARISRSTGRTRWSFGRLAACLLRITSASETIATRMP